MRFEPWMLQLPLSGATLEVHFSWLDEEREPRGLFHSVWHAPLHLHTGCMGMVLRRSGSSAKLICQRFAVYSVCICVGRGSFLQRPQTSETANFFSCRKGKQTQLTGWWGPTWLLPSLGPGEVRTQPLSKNTA